MENYPKGKSEEEWKKILSPEEYRILREKGTEYPNTGEYNLSFEDGIYCCAGCHSKLFESGHKFASNCGWPSFDESIEGAIEYKKDRSHGMYRIEVLCANCGGHLGHVFDDGPTETRTRYCINSVSIKLDKK
ncbi:peptide-methionine (R)-S-oxide reductase MsrB [Aureivirga sp. CE67]|uniref:peptide-methionine (R)-S-oxide reductase MsrB n=1 Tax=Aureivirga sp. CE67 TaxID=1788983 RepID=UPI0018CB0C2F|nr:peptide-methionine (R)-S-oxide reductase MsrB [Aureivirga sp. CE67]